MTPTLTHPFAQRLMNEKDDSNPSPSDNDDKPVSVPRRARLRRWLPRLMFVMLTVGAVVAGVFWWQEHSLAVAETALGDGELEYALYLAENFLENRPSHVRALSLRARALVALRSNPDEALRIFDEVGAASAEEVHAWAQACLMKQRWSQALPLLVRSVQMTPTDANAIYELAICRTHLGQLEEALETAQRMVELPDNEARGQMLVGTIHGDMGNVEGAAEAYASVLQYEPEGENLQVPPHSFFLQYGRALLQSGKPAASIGPLKISVSKTPTADAFVELGEAASQIGEIKNAELAWKEALKYSPLDRQARESLANSALQALAAEDALKWLGPLEEVPGMREIGRAACRERV